MAKQIKQKSTLTMSKVSKDQKKYSEKYLFEYSDGESILVSKVFRPSLIEKLLEEYGTLVNFYEEETEVELSDKDRVYFLYFLILKYFTDLGKEVSEEPLLLWKQFYDFVDSIYLTELINEGFPKDEVAKVFDKSTDVIATYSFLGNLTSQINTKFEDLNLQNKDVLANLGNSTQSE
jgi:hypothetical protein